MTSIHSFPNPINRGSIMNNEKYIVRIADESFNFQEFSFDDSKITGAEVADAFGAHPVENYRIYQQVKNLELEELRPIEKADISNLTDFYVIQGDASFNFIVDGLNFAWPKPIRGEGIKKLIKKDSTDFELFLDRKTEKDELIDDDQVVDITDSGVEHFYTQKKSVISIEIIVEGTPHLWHKNEISYDEVVTLEVPDYASHPEITYSVKYKKGPGIKPEGILTKGAIVKVKTGMVFNVSETGQS